MREVRWQKLTEEECRKLLAERHLGRLALVDADGPVIFPVNHALDEGAVVFRTDPGSKLDAAAVAATVAFESTPPMSAPGPAGAWWSAGRAAEVATPADLQRLRRLPLYPWARCQDLLHAHPAGRGHRPAHRHHGRPAVHLVGLTVPPRHEVKARAATPGRHAGAHHVVAVGWPA